ncbi:RAB GTPase-activating protein, putative, partial [Ixodes scapularis]
RHSRTMLLLVLRRELCLLSTDRKQLLVNKPFCDISRCYLGTKHPDHFGFNCRDSSLASTDNYIAHIFKCSSVEVANEIMQTLKQAFHSALQTKEPCPPQLQGLCDSCPMQRFHKLCLDLEGLSSDDCCSAIQRYIQQLSDSDKQSIAAKYQVREPRSVQEKNELYMSLLRGLYEGKQARHTHHSSLVCGRPGAWPLLQGFLDLRAPSFTFDHLKEKAKKSLSNSFDTILKVGLSPPSEPGRSGGRLGELRPELPLPPRIAFVNRTSFRSMVYTFVTSASRLTTFSIRSVQVARAPSCPLPADAERDVSHGARIPAVLAGGQRGSRQPKGCRNAVVRFCPAGGGGPPDAQEEPARQHVSSTEESPLEPGSSWRQAIFQRVHSSPNQGGQTRSRSSIANHGGRSSDGGPKAVRCNDAATPFQASPAAGETRKTREELRGLWRKAIMEQILLIRMEKENRQLQVSQDEATSKRLRLAYEEVCPCPREACDQWDQLLAMGPGERINPDLLADLVRAGLPRHRRGEIWLLLAEQCKLRRPPCQGAEVDLSVGYQQLLNQLTSYQHAILIDLGRTFPSHPFFRECLGPGQLSLFNLLKAYSLLDPQVGYCQGLSFVAGVLLLHMTEEEAFEMMKHFLFHLGFRKQYKPDMLALQVELYQLYRLLHDHQRELYVHLEKYDVGPALFAAPWFLTLFASQFPLGFVSRLFDVIFLQGAEAVFKVALSLLGVFSAQLMACSSFEAIMDCFKSGLPSLSLHQMEALFAQVLSLDLGRELCAYEVEYQLIQEQAICRAPGEDQRNMHLLEQLQVGALKSRRTGSFVLAQVSQSSVGRLEAQVASYQGTVRHLEDRIRKLEDERDALLHSNGALRHRLERLERGDADRAPERSLS